MSLFQYNPFDNLIGLDISDSKIRFIQFNRKGREKAQINAFSEAPLEPGLMSAGETKNPTKIVRIISGLVEKPQFGKVKSQFVNFSLPEKRSFVKVVSIPNVPDNEQPGAVRWAIEQNIPVEIQESNYDWQIIPRQPNTEKDKLSVMVSVTPKKIVESFTRMVVQAGLEPVCAENESIANTRALIPNSVKETESIMIIDLGRSRTNIMIYSNNAVQFSSTIEVSGNEMTKAVADKLHLSFEDAEKIKILYGLDSRKGRGKIQTVLKPLMMQLVGKINEYVEYYNQYMLEQRSISRILLTGNVSNLHGVKSFFEQALHVPIQRGNSYEHIHVTNADDPVIAKLNISSFTTAIGLALKDLQ